ncbi:MAG: 50S ribosomal protein L17 [Deltaproteobacteria bacterium]|nr:50S ribosomal protein L17 [Deltaproteobacteria bacterium]
MRHKNAGRKFNRTPAHRKAMFRALLTNLFRHEKIETTDAKAKELRRLADKVITLGKAGGLHAIRSVASVVNDAEVARKIFTTIAKRFPDRLGGYTRVVKLGRRMGDGAAMSLVEIIGETKPGKKDKGKTPKGEKTPKAAAPKKPKEKPAPEKEPEKPAEPEKASEG